jgi:hypothetical protein
MDRHHNFLLYITSDHPIPKLPPPKFPKIVLLASKYNGSFSSFFARYLLPPPIQVFCCPPPCLIAFLVLGMYKIRLSFSFYFGFLFEFVWAPRGSKRERVQYRSSEDPIVRSAY